MTLNEYCKKYDISKSKAEKSLVYVKDIKVCPYCQKKEIPEDADIYYVPDKRIMKNDYRRKYFYLLEAIFYKQKIHKDLTGIDEETIKVMIDELKQLNLIEMNKKTSENALNYLNYELSLVGCIWMQKTIKEKREELINYLKNVIEIGSIVARVVF